MDFYETALGKLRRSLPPHWMIASAPPRKIPFIHQALVLELPGRATVELLFHVTSKAIGPRAADRLTQRLARLNQVSRRVAVHAPYISPSARLRLEAKDVGYVDDTGNLRLWADDPPFLISTSGADRNPTSPPPSRQQTLQGAAAGATVRALVDHLPPYGVRQIADIAEVSPATVSRTLRLLMHEGLVTRDSEGWSDLDWQATLRLWARDYTPRLEAEARLVPTLGFHELESSLRSYEGSYAVTGRAAVHPLARLAPVDELALYVEDLADFQQKLGLVAHNAMGSPRGTVRAMQPRDTFVFARAEVEAAGPSPQLRSPLRYVAYSQLAVDLLTGPGREPAEGEALMARMAAHELDWRRSL